VLTEFFSESVAVFVQLSRQPRTGGLVRAGTTAPDQSRDAHTITIGAFEAFVTFARLHGVTLRMVTGAWLQIFCGNYTEASALLNELVALADEKGAAFWSERCGGRTSSRGKKNFPPKVAY
jgi:hypothetical protein